MQDGKEQLKEKFKERLEEICFSFTGVTIVAVLIWAILLMILILALGSGR